jgi:hypothetical protein
MSNIANTNKGRIAHAYEQAQVEKAAAPAVTKPPLREKPEAWFSSNYIAGKPTPFSEVKVTVHASERGARVEVFLCDEEIELLFGLASGNGNNANNLAEVTHKVMKNFYERLAEFFDVECDEGTETLFRQQAMRLMEFSIVNRRLKWRAAPDALKRIEHLVVNKEVYVDIESLNQIGK